MRAVGGYQLLHPIATGGMAHVWLARSARGPVAVKQMLPAFASDKAARAMLADEARVARRIAHPNVVRTLELVEDKGELFLVLEHVLGESLDKLPQPPPSVALAIVQGALRGLHAAHEAKAEDGAPLELVHRDVSPQNIVVDTHGVARVLDFGVARARGRLQATREGQLKGKLAYLAPEQVHGEASRRSDVFAAGVVLWELLAGRRLFDAASEAEVLSKVLLCQVPRLESAAWPVLEKALAREPSGRFTTAADMADALTGCASADEVAAWLRNAAGPALGAKEAQLAKARTRPRTGVIAASVLAAVAAIAAAALMFWPQAPAPVAAAAPPPAAEPPAQPAPPQPAPEAPKPITIHTGAGRKAPPRPDCTPPYTIDAQGVKRFKVECLH